MIRRPLLPLLAALAACGSAGMIDEGDLELCPAVVSGCTTWDDTTTTVEFGGAHGDSYAPPCLRVSVNEPITFAGDFAVHPLRQVCGPAPAIPSTSSGGTATFQLTMAGTYGYFCSTHGDAGMVGAIDVVP